MQLSQNLSFQTQHELANLFECIIIGMRQFIIKSLIFSSRIQKCFLYFKSLQYNRKEDYIFWLIAKENQVITWQRLADFLHFHKVILSREQVVGLLLIMGGGVEYITSDELRKYLKSRDEIQSDYAPLSKNEPELKLEIEMTFVKMLEEEMLLEQNSDVMRNKIEKRWDYQLQLGYKCIAKGSDIDYTKFKKFFQRLRKPINDEELYHLIKRFGNEGSVNIEAYQRVLLSLGERVKLAVDEWAGINKSKKKETPNQKKSNYHEMAKKNNRYFERLKRKYMQNNYTQQLKSMSKSRGSSQHQQPKRTSSEQKINNLLTQSAVLQKKTNLQDLLDRQKLSQSQHEPFRTPDKQQELKDRNTSKIMISKQNYPNTFQTTQKKIDRQDDDIYFLKKSVQTEQIEPVIYLPKSDQFFQDFQPLFTLINSIILNTEQLRDYFSNLTGEIIFRLCQIKSLPDWSYQWKVVGINTYDINYDQFSKFVKYFFKENLNQSFENFQPYVMNIINKVKQKLTQSEISELQSVFDQIVHYTKLIQQSKITFFQNKSCSFIQIFEEIDQGHKGFLDIKDIEMLLQKGKINDKDHILFDQFNDFDTESSRISFQQFLKALTP